MTTFEERIREMCLLTPRLPLRTAVQLAERGDEPVPFPTNPMDAEQGALWAAQFPEIMNLVCEGRRIQVVKEIRDRAPRSNGNRTLGLLEAKLIMESLMDGETRR